MFFRLTLPICLVLSCAAALLPLRTTAYSATHVRQQLNAVQRENLLPGTTSWLPTDAAPRMEIQGYAALTSVAPRHRISIMVSTIYPSFSATVYRMGWYGGAGARQVTSRGHLPGHLYPNPTPDPTIGLIACHWPAAFSLYIPSKWLSGIYLVKLTGSDGHQAYIRFVVRDSRPSPYVFVRSVTTDEAYNNWGGKSLYLGTDGPRGGDVHLSRAVKVSFDRPELRSGGGAFFFWEYQMVRWLERNGYDVSYITDVDLHEQRSILFRHRAVLIVGHSEYWSYQMRSHLTAAIYRGVSVGVFAANTMYWQVRYEPLDGVRDRVVVCYKYPGVYPGDSDPHLSTDPPTVTGLWRAAPVYLPESEVLGAMFGEEALNAGAYPWVVADPNSWIYAGTGLGAGSTIPDIVGYEYDGLIPGYPVPSNLDVVAASPVVSVESKNQVSSATLYQADSGAWVFNAATVDWSWGLDGFTGFPLSERTAQVVNPAVARITANILSAMAQHSLTRITGRATPDKVSTNPHFRT